MHSIHISCNHLLRKLLHAVLLLRKVLTNDHGVYGLDLVSFKADNPARKGTHRSLPVNVIDGWQLSGLSNDMTQRVENVIKRLVHPTEQAFE